MTPPPDLLPSGQPPVIAQWTPSSYFGWGVYGLNLALTWRRDGLNPIVFSAETDPGHIVVNPLARLVLDPVLQQSRQLQETLRPHAGQALAVPAPVLHALGNGLTLAGISVGLTQLYGDPTIGMVFFEDAALGVEARARAIPYAMLVAGSRWNHDLLTAAGIGPVGYVMQGVDTTLFHPAPRAGYIPGRFLIFSGGKLEFRKGQDLVLLAFRAFRQRHPEALLVTAWHSPWPHLAAEMANNPAVAAFPYDAQGRPDIPGWAAANGLPPGSIIDLGTVPNSLLPQILREMDAALFPNRCEGGTNLVAMECLACGVPTIVSANSGHLDLIEGGGCLPLRHQSPVRHPVTAASTEGWGESDVEEAVAALEQIWQDRTAAAALAARGAAFMAGHDWAEQTRRLHRLLAPLLGPAA